MEKETRKYNCLVVEDEPIARKIIISYIDKLPMLQLAAEKINALDAIDYLKQGQETDIIFLDISMPHLSGIELMRIIQPKQPVILTTAYTQYAIESYEVSAVDYLLKPFSFERFTKAVFKAIDVIRQSQNRSGDIDKSRMIYIKSDGKNYPVDLSDILYCEAMKNYTMVMLKSGKKLMPLVPLSKFEAVLAEAGGDFIQVHRSFVVSRAHIESVSASTVMVEKHEIPIGIQFKDKFLKTIGIDNS